ncbi:hypothetical protein [Amycolatopsis solani]|uniref:hypothetical protein n=1 Tax=Amycolatopsis solani TaxID=3028615 RepID=UPI00296F0837|nr:hypothetical protein [Amycolatopsis sp. MEP2-6]
MSSSRPPRRARRDTTRPGPARPAQPRVEPTAALRPSRVRQLGETRDEYIARIVAAAPPLSEAQRARLRPVLAPVRASAAVA